MFRLLYTTFSGKFRGTEEQWHHVHESPAAMTMPLIVLAILSVIGGLIGVPEVIAHGWNRLGDYLGAAGVRDAVHGEVSHSTEWILMAVATGVALIGILFARMRYRNYREEKSTPFARVLENKWYVDELYDTTISKPVYRLGGFAGKYMERSGIDAIVNGMGRLVNYTARQMRWLQSGQVGSYVLLMVISMVLFFVLEFFLRK
jgi:NADH-quinone oxidoreductase subunit L